MLDSLPWYKAQSGTESTGLYTALIVKWAAGVADWWEWLPESMRGKQVTVTKQVQLIGVCGIGRVEIITEKEK